MTGRRREEKGGGGRREEGEDRTEETDGRMGGQRELILGYWYTTKCFETKQTEANTSTNAVWFTHSPEHRGTAAPHRTDHTTTQHIIS